MNKKHNSALISGAKWAIVSKWYNRLIGLASVLVLARLLSPDDFGIAAISSFFIFLFLAFSSMSTTRVIILEDKISDETLNSLWSLNLVLRFLSAILLFISAPWVSSYTNEARVELVIQIVAIIPFLMAFRNVGLDVFEKELNFRTTTIILIVSKTIGTFISIAIAVIWHSYWALILASIVSVFIEVVIGYIACSYRPRWSTSRWGEQWKISKWLYLATISGYLRSRVDVMILGNLLNSRMLGVYNFSQELAWLPFTDLVSPLHRGFFAVLSQLKDDQEAFSQRVYQQLTILMLVVLPCSFGVSAISEPFVRLVLGLQWLDAIPVMSHLAGLMVVMTFYMPLTVILMVKNRMSILVLSDLFIVIIISIVFYLLSGNTVEELSLNRLLVGVSFMFIMMGLYVYFAKLNLAYLLSIVLLPLVCSWLMYEFVSLLTKHVEYDIAKLSLSILSGVIVYVGTAIAGMYMLKTWIHEYHIVVQYLKKQICYRLGLSRDL